MGRLTSLSSRASTRNASAAGTTARTWARIRPTPRSAAAAWKISMVQASTAPMRSLGTWFGLSALLVVLDQITKIVIQRALVPGQSIDVLPPAVTLVLAYNPGAAFSFLASGSGWQRYFFLAIALIASVLIVYMMSRHRSDRFLCFALSLVLGVAVGNLIDRLVY